MAALKLVCALFTYMLVVAPPMSHANMTCAQVVSRVSTTHCLGYLVSTFGGTSVPIECCYGIKAINSIAVTTTDRRYACECLKDLAKSVSGINATLAASLPGKCGVNITYSISTSNNCAQVK